MSEEPSESWGTGPTRYFYDLTPEVVLSAVEKWGYRPTGRLMALNSMENRVFEAEILPPETEVTSESERFRILKFYRPGRWSREQITEEHLFTRDLVEADIPVISPETNPQSGQTCQELEEAGIFFTVFPKAGGRNPDELDITQLNWIGRLMARMHNVGAARDAPSRIRLDPEHYGDPALDDLVDRNVIPEHLEDSYLDLAEEILDRATPLFENTTMLRIHGDAHHGNLLWSDQGPFWVDFDDMLNGPAIQDLWLLCSGRDSTSRLQLDALLKGYQWMRTFDRNELRLIEPLRAMRYIRFASWISKRWTDPAFPKAFPFFDTHDYWQNQIEDLRESLDAMKSRDGLPWCN